MNRHPVSDHALLRYLELVHGLDAEDYRGRIARLAESGIRHGSTGVIVEGVKLVIRDGRVVSVIDRHLPSCDRRSTREVPSR